MEAVVTTSVATVVEISFTVDCVDSGFVVDGVVVASVMSISGEVDEGPEAVDDS